MRNIKSNYEHCILGFNLHAKFSNHIYVYEISEDQIGKARWLLYRDGIPHAIARSRKHTGLEIYTSERGNNLENSLYNNKPKTIEKIPPIIKHSILTSAVRLKFLENQWRSSTNKLFYDKEPRSIVASGYAHLYDAIKATVDSLHGNRTVLFMDYSSKIEFVTTLDQIPIEIANNISWVKIKNQTLSFYIVRRINIYDNIDELLTQLPKIISDYIGQIVSIDKSEKVVLATPRSLRFNEYLKKRTKLSIDNLTNRVLLPLPSNVLVPVGYIDNLTLFGDLPRLTKSPYERLDYIRKIASETNIARIEYPGVDVKIEVDKHLVLMESDIYIPRESNKPNLTYISVEANKASSWIPKFTQSKRRKLVVVDINCENLCDTNRAKKYREYSALINKSIIDLSRSSRFGGLEFHAVSANPDLSDLEDRVSSLVHGYDKVYSILLYDECFDPTKTLSGKFEYIMAKNKVYPHVIDVGKLIAYESKKGYEDYVLKAINSIILNIMRDFAIRSGEHPFKLRPPSGLEDFLVIGIDATIRPMKKGCLYIAAAAIILNPDGTHESRVLKAGESDADVLRSALRSILLDPNYKNKNAIVILNKSSLLPFVGDFEGLEGPRHGDRELILTSVSKTHSFSRVFKSADKDKILNPDQNDIGLLVKLKAVEVNSDKGLSATISRFLAISTSHPRGGWEEGSIHPILINVMGRKDHITVAQYMIALAHYGRISSYWPPSLPWPLRRADILSKRIHRILDTIYMETGGLSLSIEELAKYL